MGLSAKPQLGSDIFGLKLNLTPGSVTYPSEELHAEHLMLQCSRFNRHANQQQEIELFASAETETQRFQMKNGNQQQVSNKRDAVTNVVDTAGHKRRWFQAWYG